MACPRGTDMDRPTIPTTEWNRLIQSESGRHQILERITPIVRRLCYKRLRQKSESRQHYELTDLIQTTIAHCLQSFDKFKPRHDKVDLLYFVKWYLKRASQTTVIFGSRRRPELKTSQNGTAFCPYNATDLRYGNRRSEFRDDIFGVRESIDCQDNHDGPVETSAAREEIAAVRKALANLDPLAATIVRMKHGIDSELMTYEEIGRCLGFGKNKVMHLYHEAVRQLRSALTTIVEV